MDLLLETIRIRKQPVLKVPCYCRIRIWLKSCSVSIASVFPNVSFMREEQVPLATSFQVPIYPT